MKAKPHASLVVSVPNGAVSVVESALDKVGSALVFSAKLFVPKGNAHAESHVRRVLKR